MNKLKPLFLSLLLFAATPVFAQGNDASNIHLLWAYGGSLAAIFFSIFLAMRLLKLEEGNKAMIEIASAIREGADAFLKQQYKWVAVFVVVVFALLFWLYGTDSSKQFGVYAPFSFLTGAVVSALSGFIGMKIATRANARTAWAANESLNAGLRVAFSSGSIMGMTVVGLGLLMVTIWYMLLHNMGASWQEISDILFTFGMGASSVALFARVGGGIYTKAADVGADLVGKVEAGIPEDDPRNPATIADNVGDNVGDVAGMGADLFESYVGSIVATIALAATAFVNSGEKVFVAAMSPLALAGAGILASVIGTFLVKTKENAKQESLLWSLRVGTYSASLLVIVLAYVLLVVLFDLGIGIFFAVIAGLIAGNIIGYFTEYYTSDTYAPTQKVAASAETGPATVIISGLALGMRSTMIPVITVVVATIIAFFAAGGGDVGLFGIGMAAVGMLSTLGITLSTDAYGPVADNAGGVAEMSHLDPKVRQRTDALDSLGNTTAATGKGFAIGSAALTALTLLAALNGNLITQMQNLGAPYVFSLVDPRTLSGLFIGGMIPFFFSALTMEAVGTAAMSMVQEVRRQFKEIKGIMEGKTKPDYQRCVAISTEGALRQMVGPTLLAVLSPIVVGILLGPAALMAMLAGGLVSGFSIAIMMANAGGAWDNAKKYIEGGKHGGKGSDAHKAAVTGDTVGDPFKDTSGPSINILIKLMSMVALVFGSFLAKAFVSLFG